MSICTSSECPGTALRLGHCTRHLRCGNPDFLPNAYRTPAAPKGAAFSCAELEALEAVSIPARLACLKLKLMQWVDFKDDDSVASALVTIGEKPSDYMHEWSALVYCARVLRDGPSSA